MSAMKSRLRRFLRLLAAEVFYGSGLFWLWCRYQRARGRGRRVCVLGLHRVLSGSTHSQTDSQGSIVLSEANFESMLQFLHRHFRLLSLQEFIAGAVIGATGAKPYCLLTFDDGWSDNCTIALPILRRMGIPATVLLVTGLVGTEKSFWVEDVRRACRNPMVLAEAQKKLSLLAGRKAELCDSDAIIECLKHMPGEQRQRWLEALLPSNGKPPQGPDRMLTWEQVVEMSHQDVDFGAHTDTHPLLSFEEDAVVERELQTAAEKIQRVLKHKVKAFAYPNGDWNSRVRERVKNAGYECAFTTRPGWYHPAEDRYSIPRILLHDGNLTGWDGRFSPAVLSFTLTGWR